jgi:hypothetical protein
LSNNNEITTVAFPKKIQELNSPFARQSKSISKSILIFFQSLFFGKVRKYPSSTTLNPSSQTFGIWKTKTSSTTSNLSSQTCFSRCGSAATSCSAQPRFKVRRETCSSSVEGGGDSVDLRDQEGFRAEIKVPQKNNPSGTKF